MWIFDDDPEAPSLGYGCAESDDGVVAFSCQPMARRMTIVEAIGPKKLNPGGAATFRLTAESGLDLTGDAIANESDGTVSIEVNGGPNPRFSLCSAGPA